MAAQRPGRDRILELVEKYDALSPGDVSQLSESQLIQDYLVPFFQALEWDVRPEDPKQSRRRFDLTLTYRDLVVPVEVKRPAGDNQKEIFEQFLTLASDYRFGILTNFASIQIWDAREGRLILETTPHSYVEEANDSDILLAAPEFYRVMVEKPKSESAERAAKPPLVVSGGQKGETFGVPAGPATTYPPGTGTPKPPESPPVTSEAPEPDKARRLDIAMRALADSPSKTDLLHFGDYARALADFIKSEKTDKPLTIGIDASWGVGKTTLMRLIKEELHPDDEKQAWWTKFASWWLAVWMVVWDRVLLDFRKSWASLQDRPQPVASVPLPVLPVVEFNAWKYDTEDSIWAALVLEIVKQVRKKLPLGDRLVLDCNLFACRWDWEAFVKDLLKVVVPAILGGAVMYVAILWSGQPVGPLLAKYWTTVGFLGGIAAIYTLGQEFRDNIGKVFDLNITKYIQTPDYEARVGFLAAFQADFAKVVRVITRDGKRPLVIFIDDLDRCEPPKPVEIIEAINLLLEAKHCVFVIGMDSRAVAASIEAKYSDLREYLTEAGDPSGLTLGRRFLEKIVQIDFRIPKSDRETVEAFVNANLSPVLQGQRPEDLRSQVAQARALIQARQSLTGQSVDDSADKVKQQKPHLRPEAIVEAKQQLFAETFDDSPVVREAIYSVIRYLELNPRKIKRFINLFRLQALIAKRQGKSDLNAGWLKCLARCLLLGTYYPDVVESTLADEAFVDRFKEAHKLNDDRKSQGLATEKQTLLEGLLSDGCIKCWVNDENLAQLLDDMGKEGELAKLKDYVTIFAGAHSKQTAP